MGWTAVGTIGSTAAAGGSGQPGQRGADGTKVLVGSAPPSLLLGNVGDLYFQTPPPGATGPILIPGPQGPPGLPGPTGGAGPAGPTVGFDGVQFTPPVASTWAFTSNHAATGSSKGNALQIYAPAGNNDLYSYWLKSSLPTPPYSITAYLVATDYPATNYASFGLMWFDTVHTYLKATGFVYNNAYLHEVGYGKDGTAHIVTDYATAASPNANVRWFRLRDDNTNQYYDYSTDGINWINLYSQVRNTDVTPNAVGFYLNVRNATYPATLTMLSYSENGNGNL